MQCRQQDPLIIMGDFNAKVGEGREENGGPHGLGIINIQGEENGGPHGLGIKKHTRRIKWRTLWAGYQKHTRRRKWRTLWAGHQKHKREENVLGPHGLSIRNREN